MINVKHEIKGDELVLRVNLKEEHGRSKSGKTIIVASTQGNVQLGGVTVGLNVYKK